LAGDSLAVVYGEFQGSEFEAVGFDLHFDCPAVVGIAHFETLQRFAADYAEFAEVGVAGAEEYARQPRGQPVAECLLGRVGSSFADGSEQAQTVFGVIAAVGVQKSYNLRGGRERGDSCEARLAVAPAGFADHASAVLAGYAGRGVARAVVDHDDVGIGTGGGIQCGTQTV